MYEFFGLLSVSTEVDDYEVGFCQAAGTKAGADGGAAAGAHASDASVQCISRERFTGRQTQPAWEEEILNLGTAPALYRPKQPPHKEIT